MTSHHPTQLEDRKREIVGMYDRAAGTSDRVGIQFASYFGNRLVESLAIPAGAQVLDVATGRGALLFPTAQRVGQEGRVIGIDLAPKMVDATAAEIISRRHKQAEVCLMDGDHPTFPDHSFDYVLCGFALHFLDYPRSLVRFHQMLKPGGSIAIVGPYVPTDDHENMERWQWLFQLTREVFPPNFEPPSFWTAPNRLNTSELVTTALREAGFDDITAWREEKVMYFVDEEDWWAWEWSQGSRFWLEGMSPDGLAKFKAASFEKLCQIKVAEGIPMRMGAQFAIGKAPENSSISVISVP